MLKKLEQFPSGQPVSAYFVLLSFLFLFFGCHPEVSADVSANLLSEAKRFYAAKPSTHVVVGADLKSFKVHVNGKMQYGVSGLSKSFQYGVMGISDDGMVVVWLLAPHAYGAYFNCVGCLDKDLLTKEEGAPALMFFREGVLIRSYPFNELVVRPYLLQWSTSHLSWIGGSSYYQVGGDAEAGWDLSPDGSEFSILTGDFQKYKFDPRSGQVLEASDLPGYRDAELLIRGDIRKLKDGILRRSEWEGHNYYLLDRNISKYWRHIITPSQPVKPPGTHQELHIRGQLIEDHLEDFVATSFQVLKGDWKDQTALYFRDPSSYHQSCFHCVVALKKESGTWHALSLL